MRGVERAQARQLRESPRGVPQVAAVQRRHSRPRGEQDDLLAKDGVDMGIWPIAPATGELHDVVFLDGIWLRRKAVVLVAVAGGHVVGWHLAQSECASAWAALMLRMPPPKMLVSDGSPGLAKAASAVWPGTRVQRCTFHAAGQVKRCTTLKPRSEAGVELLGIANRLMGAKDAGSAIEWLLEYNAWSSNGRPSSRSSP